MIQFSGFVLAQCRKSYCDKYKHIINIELRSCAYEEKN